METRGKKIWRVVSSIRTVTAWLVILALISMLAAEDMIRGYARPWPADFPMPAALAWIILWRNVSLLALVILIVVSIPRWQSLVGIAALVIFFTFFAQM